MRIQERGKRKLGWCQTSGRGCFRKCGRDKHLEENTFFRRKSKECHNTIFFQKSSQNSENYFLYLFAVNMGRDSAVGIATR